MFVFFVHNGIETTTYFTSGRLQIDRASLECKIISGRRVPVTRRSGPSETAASEFLDGLVRTVGSMVAVRY